MNIPKYFIGPMSKNVVDCIIDHQNCFGFIPSRRQIDFDCGYVNDWNTETFSKYVKSRNKNILLCRDHGGEMQGKNMDDGNVSFSEDCRWFNIIHIDPFKSTKSIYEAAEKTTRIIKKLYATNRNVRYEVGTEEAIFPYSPVDLLTFLSYIKLNVEKPIFNQILFAVVQSGTRLDLPNKKNIGDYDQQRLLNFLKIVNEFGIKSKEHNGDHLTTPEIKEKFDIGLDAINIAPEFGQIETEFYLEECSKDQSLFLDLYNMCHDSRKWDKWIEDPSKIEKNQLISTCCHYIISSNEFVDKIKSKFPFADERIKRKINQKLSSLYHETEDSRL